MGKRFEELNMKVPNAKPILGYKGNLPFYYVTNIYVENVAYAIISRNSVISSKGI